MSKTNKTIITLILLSVFFGLGCEVVQAAHESMYLEVPLGSYKRVEYPYFTDYLEELFKYFVAVTALLAAVSLMWGGFQWVAASGNQKVIGSAKETIMNAAVGLIIALTAYLLMFTLNPRLVELDFPGVSPPTTVPGQIGNCEGTDIDLYDPVTNTCYIDDLDEPESGADPFNTSYQIPCNMLCRDYNENPNTVVYGACRFCSNPLIECGVQTAGDNCDIDGCGCRGTWTGRVQKGCFVVSREGTTDASFSVMEKIQIEGAAERGFTVLSWKGDDGADSASQSTESYKDFKCGEIYWETSSLDTDGLYGTWCDTGAENRCVIDYESGVNWNGRSLEYCRNRYYQGESYCLIGRFRNYWCPEGEDGANCSS